MTAMTLFDLDSTPEPPPPAAGYVCTCTPGVRCQSCGDRGRASLRLMRLAGETDPSRSRIDWWNRQTSVSDARVLLSLACGVPIDQISRTGHSPAGWKFTPIASPTELRPVPYPTEGATP